MRGRTWPRGSPSFPPGPRRSSGQPPLPGGPAAAALEGACQPVSGARRGTGRAGGKGEKGELAGKGAGPSSSPQSGGGKAGRPSLSRVTWGNCKPDSGVPRFLRCTKRTPAHRAVPTSPDLFTRHFIAIQTPGAQTLSFPQMEGGQFGACLPFLGTHKSWPLAPALLWLEHWLPPQEFKPPPRIKGPNVISSGGRQRE